MREEIDLLYGHFSKLDPADIVSPCWAALRAKPKTLLEKISFVNVLVLLPNLIGNGEFQ